MVRVEGPYVLITIIINLREKRGWGQIPASASVHLLNEWLACINPPQGEAIPSTRPLIREKPIPLAEDCSGVTTAVQYPLAGSLRK